MNSHTQIATTDGKPKFEVRNYTVEQARQMEDTLAALMRAEAKKRGKKKQRWSQDASSPSGDMDERAQKKAASKAAAAVEFIRQNPKAKPEYLAQEFNYSISGILVLMRDQTVIDYLRENPGAPTKEIGTLIKRTRQAAGVQLNRLRNRGLVVRHRIEDKKMRSYLWSLADQEASQ